MSALLRLLSFAFYFHAFISPDLMAQTPNSDTDKLKSYDELTKVYDNFFNEIKAVGNQPTAECSVSSKTESGLPCSKDLLCKSMVPSNSEGLYLYKNTNGEKLVNWNVVGNIEMLRMCIQNLSHKLDINQSIVGPIKESYVGRYELKRNLYHALQENPKDLTAYSNLIEKMSDSFFKQASADKYGGAQSPCSEPNELEEVKCLEKAFKVDFSSDKVRTLIAKSLRVERTNDTDEILKILGKEKKIMQFEGAITDPFINPRNTYNKKEANNDTQQVLENYALVNNKWKSETLPLIQYTKNRLLSNALALVHNDSAASASITNRLSKLKFRLGHTENYECTSPNAFYDPQKHEFVICPQVMMLPKSSLMMIIAHEIAHSIDPCTLSSELKEYKITGDLNRTKMFLQMMKQSPDNLILSDLDSEDKTLYSVDYTEDKNTMASLKYEYLDGIEPTNNVIAKGIPAENNPFSKILTCFESPSSIEATKFDPNLAIEKVKKSLKDSDKKYSEDDLKSFINRKKYCSFVSGSIDGHRSKYEETFADWMATEVVAHEDLLSKEKAIESAGFFAQFLCPVKNSFIDKITAFRKANGCASEDNTSAFDAMSTYGWLKGDSHAGATKRVERIMFANPAIAKAIGCDPKGAKYCDF